MSKQSYLYRYSLIINKLKENNYIPFEELKSYINYKLEEMDLVDGSKNSYSIRTFQRDKKEIESLFGFEITYSKRDKAYTIISQDVINENYERMFEAFDIFNTLKIAQNLSPLIYTEKQKPQGTENLLVIFNCIKKKCILKFDYQKFWEDEKSVRNVEPYALREYKKRWYLIAKDQKDNKIKTFGLDRISNIEKLKKRFIYPADFNVKNYFKNCFGISSPDNEEPVDIKLSFQALQGKYIKTLPLHETQEIISENEKEFVIKLKLFISYEFIMELLSYGSTVKVLEPKSLIDRIKTELESAVKNYS